MEQVLVEGNEKKESITELINKADNLIGAKGIAKTLKFYNKYITMNKKDKMEVGNFNIALRCDTRESTYEEVLEIINTILVKHKIVKGEYIEIESRIDEKKIKEKKVYVIDYEEESYHWGRDRIRKVVKKNPNTVFILVCSNDGEDADELANIMKNAFYWNIVVQNPTEEEKEEYIKDQIEKTGFTYNENNAFIQSLAKKEIYEIKQELMEAFVEAKLSRRKVLEDKYFNIEEQEKAVKEKEGLKKLEQLTGLEDVKRQIKKIINYVDVHKERNAMPMLHMCMTGSPGTGKTTVARIIGEIFSDLRNIK